MTYEIRWPRYSGLSHPCGVRDCKRFAYHGTIKVLECAEGDPELYLCPDHFKRLTEIVKQQKTSIVDIRSLSNEQVVALLSGNEFQQTIANIVADEKFKDIIRQRVRESKRRLCKPSS